MRLKVFRVSWGVKNEYGPPMYAHTLPGSGILVSDVPEITGWAMNRLKTLFQSTVGFLI